MKRKLFFPLLLLIPGLVLGEPEVEPLAARLAAARAVGDKGELAAALTAMADAHRSASEHEPALGYYAEAIGLYEELGEKSPLGAALNHVGAIYRRISDYSQALEHHFQAQRTFEEAGDRRGVARTLNYIGIVHRQLGQYSEALAFYRESLAIYEDLGDEEWTGKLLNNIGNVYRYLDQLPEAAEHLSRSLEIKEKLDDRQGIANTLNNLGLTHQALGDPGRALEYYRRSLEIKGQLGDRKGTANTLQHVANAHRQRGELGLALARAREALAIATEVNARDDMVDSHLELSEIYAELGRYREAYEAFKGYERVKSEIFNERNSEIVAEMQARYETERKEREIEILKQKQALDALALDKQRTTVSALIAGLALLLAISLLLYNRYRLKARATLAIEQKNSELEHYVAKLEAKQAEVERKNAELERFTYTVSHDLKSPLVTIKGFLGFVRKDAVAGDLETLDHDIGNISQAVDKMQRLLDELLELSRIGRQVNPPEEVAFGELVAEARELVAGEIRERGVEVTVAPGLPVVVGDRARLLEVVQNLLQNAVKYMGDQPSPRIEFGVRPELGEGRGEVLYVADNGMGIEPQYHDKVFGLFERLDAESEGSGVGLALAKRIVEVHGGKIWVESQGRGRGSTFCFTLPGGNAPPLENAGHRDATG